MCTVCIDPRTHRPAVIEDVVDISRQYPGVPFDMLESGFSVLTDHNSITPAVLIVLAEMIDRFSRNDVGIYSNPTLPFSGMDLKTYERIQTPEMVACHHVFESLVLAQRNVGMLNDYLATHGMRLVFFCDCGCAIQALDKELYDEDYKFINAFRAYAEAVGTKVIPVKSFEDPEWTSRRLDMGPSEIAAYKRMGTVLASIPKRSSNWPDSARKGMKLLKERVPCKCGNPKCASVMHHAEHV